MPGNTSCDAAIIGAGAAGLATAIFAARRLKELSTGAPMPNRRRIVCLDGATRPGAKILVSGGGRCNVTNVRVGAEDFWGGSRNTIRRVLAAFNERQTLEFFREIGVPLHEEQWGKLFPDTHSAKTVLAALLAEAQLCGVELLAGHRVVDVRRLSERFAVEVEPAGGVERRCFESRFVVLATGGKSLPKSGSDGLGYELARRLGHSIVAPTPGLVPLVLEGEFHVPLSGVSHEVEIAVRVNGAKPLRIRGPMLWTHFGVSGPAVLDASRHWHRAVLDGKTVAIAFNFLPGMDFETAERTLLDLAAAQAKSAVHNALATLLPARLVEAVLVLLAIPGKRPMGQLSREDRRRIVHALIEWPVRVRDSRGYNYAEVTAGGVPLSEIDSATMASRACPGLFLVGEILDADGRIGGFNFQWAWSSAFVAGQAIAQALPPGRP